MVELIKVKEHLKIWSSLELKAKLNLLQIFLLQQNDFFLKAADISIASSDILSLPENKVEPLAISLPLTRRRK